MNKQSKTKKRVGAFLLLAPIAILVVLIVYRGINPTPPPPKIGWKPATDTNPEYKKALTEWSSAAYVSIGENLDDTVRAITIHSDALELTQTQQDQLRQSVSSLLLAFSSGTLEDYLRFRAPIGEYKYNASTINSLREEIAKRYCKKGEQPPSEPDQVFKLYWQKCYGGNAFSNYWNGISLEHSEVLVERGRTLPANLAIYALHAANAGVADIAPVIVFEPTPEKVLKQEGELLYATVSLLIKARPPEPAHPVHCRFYWVKERSKWLPIQLVSSYVGPRDVEIVF